jgi:glutamyl-tRNA reductase
VILSTCNRVEIYAATSLESAKAFVELKQFLVRWGKTPGKPDNLGVRQHVGTLESGDAPPQSKDARWGETPSSQNQKAAKSGLEGLSPHQNELGAEFYTLAEPQSLHHLFKVACGLDSMVLGETEILGQLKQAYALAHRHGHTGAQLNKAFQRAFHTAKHIRTQTNIQRGSVSVASVAVELAEKIFGSLHDREVLVIGAGDTSEKTARALLSRGVRNIIVTSRSLERAQILAGEFGGRAVPFGDWTVELEKIDIAISSTSAPHYILDRAGFEPLIKRRKHRPLLLVDIAVPRNMDPELNSVENVYLYNIDDLQAIADDYLKQRKEEIARCEKIIAEKVKALLETKSPTDFADERRLLLSPLRKSA